MIYLTGDLHGDKKRFRARKLRKLKKGDTLIICGDFGFIWDGSKRENRLLQRIGRLRYHVLFVEGAHDNMELLEAYPVELWNGGRTHAISGNLRHLIRGERFTLEGVSILAMGGGLRPDDLQADDEQLRRALPLQEDIVAICSRMQEYDWQADLVISHQAPTNIDGCITQRICDVSLLTTMLDLVQQKSKFRLWCFGCYHQNKPVPPFYRALYDEIYCAGGAEK
ncbi:MAG: metallophosphoesterase [Angelakisella sp.]